MAKEVPLRNSDRKGPTVKLPDYYYEEYYETLAKKGPLYAILYSEGGRSRLFFGPMSTSKTDFVSYVFFRVRDAEQYISVLAKKNKDIGGKFSVWETTAEKLVNSIDACVKKEREGMSARKFHVITSIFLYETFNFVEYFWYESDTENTKIQ